LKLHSLPILGAWLIEHEPHPDKRGEVFETFSTAQFIGMGLNTVWRRNLVSRNPISGTLRGLHYAAIGSEPEFKLVRCTRGRIFDVLVDLRKTSPTYGQMVYVTLRSAAHESIYVPTGVAHGFQTVQHHTEVQYLLSTEYHPDGQAGICWNDEMLNIPWPVEKKFVSPRDQLWPKFAKG
jgi:dTDP-4-dehydrorhamnose 3,5-epimerase